MAYQLDLKLIQHQSICYFGLSADVDPKVVAEFKDRLSSIIAGFDLKDIFNCD